MVREQGMRSEALGMRPKVKKPHASYLTPHSFIFR
jgi:hypothetical protein